jgi:hypothetical protein
MKSLFLAFALAVFLIATVPAIRNSGGSSRTESAAEPEPAPVASAPPLPGPAGPPETYHSSLGYHGGLAGASLIESELGSIRVYTVSNLPALTNGQVVRLRLSRPVYQADPGADGTTYSVTFRDRDNPGSAIISFPADAAERMGLLRPYNMPGLTFYVALDVGKYRAVGLQWRADTRKYVW